VRSERQEAAIAYAAVPAAFVQVSLDAPKETVAKLNELAPAGRVCRSPWSKSAVCARSQKRWVSLAPPRPSLRKHRKADLLKLVAGLSNPHAG
jgi:hypothetical protein